jgi:hypothetical protein
VPVQDVAALQSLESVIDLCSMSYPFPDWWQFGDATCRSGALQLSTDFTGSPATSCTDPWHGSASGFVLYSMHSGSWNTARITVLVTPQNPPAVQAGTEYYAYKVRITNLKTTGSDSCAGCSTPICIVLNQITLIESGGQQDLSTPQINYAAQWQQVQGSCPFVVPVRNRTWGMIKTLYR